MFDYVFEYSREKGPTLNGNQIRGLTGFTFSGEAGSSIGKLTLTFDVDALPRYPEPVEVSGVDLLDEFRAAKAALSPFGRLFQSGYFEGYNDGLGIIGFPNRDEALTVGDFRRAYDILHGSGAGWE